ncbi:MAG: tyrosine-type recombinase/integrase [Planctomycetota bacterium]
MPKVSRVYVPKYRLHRPSGQARVTIDGQDYYLGPWKSRASLAEYDRLISEWIAGGRRLAPPDEAAGMTVVEVIAKYRRFANGYYVKHGKPTDQVRHIDNALKPLKRLYGRTLAAEFGPKRLKAVRQTYIEAGHCRGYVNDHVGRIKRMFKWAAEEELVPGGVYQALAAVSGLRRGRTEAPDRKPVEPVADEVIQGTLPYLPPVVADMVRLLRLTSMRPGEVCMLRPGDIDRSGDVWLYRHSSHKTEHHERQRIIFIGPKGQEILRPYLLRGEDEYCFSPRDSERRRLQELQANRKTPLSWGNRPGTNRKANPKRTAGEHYNKDSLNRAIRRAVDAANSDRAKEQLEPLPHWSGNRLRHSAATDIRRRYGLEAAQVMLGHAKADVTQVYAEADIQRGVDIASLIG